MDGLTGQEGLYFGDEARNTELQVGATYSSVDGGEAWKILEIKYVGGSYGSVYYVIALESNGAEPSRWRQSDFVKRFNPVSVLKDSRRERLNYYLGGFTYQIPTGHEKLNRGDIFVTP